MTENADIFQSALTHHKAGRLDEAAALYEAAIAENPGDLNSINNLAALRAARGEFEAATVWYEKLLAVEPDDAALLTNYANMNLRQQAFGEAENKFRLALALSPDLAPALAGLGQLLMTVGRFDEAAAAFAQLVAAAPESAVAHREAAAALMECGENDTAARHLDIAIELAPDDSHALFLYANLKRNAGDWSGAVELYRRSLAADPGDDTNVILISLANMLIDLRQEAEGIDILEALVAGQPDMVECWNNLGSAYLNTGRGAEAIAAFEKALELDPGLVMAANNIGTAHLKSGRPGEALAVYRRNTEKFPDHCGAWSGLGNVLVTMEKFDDAIAAFNHSLELKSDHIDAFHGRAVANHRRAVAFGGSDYSIRALDDYHKVADLNPRHFHAHQNMGAMLQILGRHDDAVEAFRRAIEINPKFVAAYSSLAHSLQQSCRWQNLEAIIERVIEYTREEMSSGSEISTSPFNLLQLSAPGDVRLAAAKQIASLYSTTVGRVSGAATFDYRANTRGKLRIGYLSPDFRSHSVGRAFQALLPAHDRERFEVFGYYTVQGGDEVTERLRRNFDGFVELAGRPFLEAAQQINDDGIDILVDLAGHTRGSRFEILALKPAPVQAHFLGYGFTTGADYVDYLITDETTIPEAEQAFCTEHVVYLPHHSLPASKPVIAEASYARAEFGLPEQGFVFADFNGHYKIDADIFTAWMRILRKAPDSVLWLMGFGASDDNLRREAEARGVAPERLIFAERRPHDEHLARLSLADLALDTYHHAGGVTSTDALWAGLPVLTLLTDGMVDRTGASLMQAAGLPELIATSVDDYMQRALGYYHDRAALADLKSRLRAKQSTAPLFDMPRFSRYLEAAYQAMWQAHLDGQNKNIRIPA